MTVDILMAQLDSKNTGYINEAQFVKNIKRMYSENQLRQFLRVDLIPNEVLDEANMQPSLAGSRINMRNDRVIIYI